MRHPALTLRENEIIEIKAYHNNYGEMIATYKGELLTEKGYEHLFEFNGLIDELTTAGEQTRFRIKQNLEVRV